MAGADYLESVPPDVAGALTISIRRSGRDRLFSFSLSDANGIRSITTSTLTASDGNTANIMGDWSRSDANTFAGTDSRRNARWNSGTLSVTYVDATSGESHTLTQTWSL